MGEVIRVRGVEGTPPYQVHWLDGDGGHGVLVYPGPGAHIEGCSGVPVR